MNWYYLDNSGDVRGPVSEQAVKELITAGVFNNSTQICPKGSKQWTTVATAFEIDLRNPNVCPPQLSGSTVHYHAATAGEGKPRPRIGSNFLGGFSRLPVPLKIGAAFVFLFGVLLLISVLTIIVFIGAADKAVTKVAAADSNQSTYSQTSDPLSSMQAEFGIKIYRDTAYLYVMGYQFGSKGASEMMGVENPKADFDELVPSVIFNNPDLSAEQKRVLESGFSDGKSGRPNRLDGIDLQLLEPAPAKRTLSEYCSLGNLPKVMELATQGNVNEPDEFSSLPLHSACATGNLQIVQHLLNLGARIDLVETSGFYPIHSAASGGNLDLFILLLKAGALIDQKTDLPEFYRDAQTASLVQSTGVNPNDGKQPIHVAAASGSYSVCQYILNNGVKFDIKDNNGLTPLHYATDYSVNGSMMWLPSNAGVIRLFDPSGAVESRFRSAVGPKGKSIRTGGVYLRIFENTGDYKIENGGVWNAHCLEFTAEQKVRFLFWTGASNNPSAIIRFFRKDSNDDVYSGSYQLRGENLNSLKVDLSSIPQEGLQILTGAAYGESLSLKFTSSQDSLQDQFFGKPEITNNESTNIGDFKFYSE